MGQKPKKLYKIGHLTSLLGVTPRTIRYYDQFGLLPHVKRSEGNVRLFDDEDIKIIKKVRYFFFETHTKRDHRDILYRTEPRITSAKKERVVN